MSAVTPFLEQQNDPAHGEAEEEEFQVPATVSAAEQGTLADDKGASIPHALQLHGVPALGDAEPSSQSMLYVLGLEVLDKTHAELLNTAYIRQAVEQSLIGRSYHVQARDIKGGRSNEVFIVLDGPIVEGFEDGETVAAWSPPATPSAQQFKVLSWTSKMGAPSFSLPAGPAEAGGSCPGAAAGQSIVPAAKLAKASDLVRRITGQPVRLQQAICQYCVTGDTRVMVRGRGLVPIGELVGEHFEVWSGKDWRETTAVAQGVREVIQVASSWGPRLRLTPDHKIKLANGEMVEAQELAVGDALAWAPPGTEPFAGPVGDGSAEDMEGALVGYVVGSGHARPGHSIGATCGSEDRDVLELMRRISAELYGTDAQVLPSGENGLQLHVGSTRTYEAFMALGLDKQSPHDHRRVPHAVWTASRPWVSGFLSGLFTADGSVSRGPRKVEVSLSQVSRPLLEEVQQLLAAFGIRSSICEYADGRVDEGYHRLWKLGVNGIDEVRRYQERIGFHDQRKQAALDEALIALSDVRGRRRVPTVHAVSRCRVHEEVYDLLNVGPERQFVANGLVISNCYAEGGQYSTGQVQFAQVLRYLWTVQSSKTSEGRAAWVDAMSYAVEHANYRLDGGKVAKTEYLPERFEGRYFRIHDSGDFFSKKYLAMWKEVANRHPDIMFWAPTRCWATPWGIAAVNEINSGGANNLVIRPSAFHINEPAPAPEQLGPGWAKGSTCYHISLVPQGAAEGAYDFDCQAYAADSDHVTCRNATGPDGKPGCRACWRFGAEMAVNYTLH